MKKLFTIVTVLALANLLGIAGFFAWLRASDRLNMERLTKIRELLSPTLSAERAAAAAAEVAEAETKRQEAEKARLAGVPKSAAERVAEQEMAKDVKLQDLLRLQQELRLLRDDLANREANLAKKRAELDDATKKFESARDQWAKTLGNDQFKQALAALEAQKPKDAYVVLKNLLEKGGDEKTQAVTYLAAMDEEVRAKILGEAIKSDGKLAADLLEQLRTRGPAAAAASASK